MADKVLANFTPYEGAKPFIFVSYSHSDSRRVIPILEAMNAQGYRVWYDEGIQWGTKWRTAIAEHIKKCSVCLAFHSTASAESPHCQTELEEMVSRKKHIFSAFLEKTVLEPGLEMYLRPYQHIDIFETDLPDFLHVIGNQNEFTASRELEIPKQQGKQENQRKKRTGTVATEPMLEADDGALEVHQETDSYFRKDGIIWTLKDGVLLIAPSHQKYRSEGLSRRRVSGYMMDYNGYSPWHGNKIKYVIITSGVCTVSDYAFSDIHSLRQVQIPSSVKWIGKYAFSGCSGLASLAIPNSVRFIDANAFADCTQLEEVVLPDRLCWISHGAFLGCDKLASVRLPPIMKFPMLLMSGAFNSTTKIEYR